MSISFGFSGCAWLITYELGVARYLKTNLPQEVFHSAKFTGTSSGSFIAAALATDTDLNKTRNVIHSLRKQADASWFGPFGNCSALVKKGLQEMVQPGIYKKANDRLYISITEQGHSFLPIAQNRLVSQFNSDEELVKSLLASCYIPGYYEEPVFINNKVCLDGGFSNNRPRIDARTIVVSPYSSSSANIKPTKVDFSFLDAFVFIPTVEKMKEMEEMGYFDCNTFWKENSEHLLNRIKSINKKFGNESFEGVLM